MPNDKWTESLDGEETNDREAWDDDVEEVDDQDDTADEWDDEDGQDDWEDFDEDNEDGDEQDDANDWAYDDREDADDWEDFDDEEPDEDDDQDDWEDYGDDDEDADDWEYDEPDDEEENDVDDSDLEDRGNPNQGSLWDYDENTNDEPDNTPDENVNMQVKALRKENAKRRRQLQELRDQSTGIIEQRVGEVIDDIATATGLGNGAEYSEQTLSEALGKRFAEAERRATEAERRLAVTVAASNAGADVDELLDSVSFTNKLDELDPTGDDFTEEVDKLVSAFYKARPTTPPKRARGGADFLSGSGAKRTSTNTVEDLAQRRRTRRGVQL